MSGSLRAQQGIPAVGAEDYAAHDLKMAFYRKLDHLSQLQAVSGMDALKDAGYEVTDENAEQIGLIVGTSEGRAQPQLRFPAAHRRQRKRGRQRLQIPEHGL